MMKMTESKELRRHIYVFNPKENGGEQLLLVSSFMDNGDGAVFLNQEITLNSYSNIASFTLSGTTITPAKLRELANQLESEMILATSGLIKSENRKRQISKQRS